MLRMGPDGIPVLGVQLCVAELCVLCCAVSAVLWNSVRVALCEGLPV